MKKNMTKMLALGLALVMTSGMMVGCSSGSSDSKGTEAAGTTAANASSTKVLRFACQNFSENIDPMTMVNAAWCVSRYGIGETLFKFDEEMNPQPNLCDTYEKSDDNKTWTLHIVDGLKYSNGNDCNPTAIVNYLNMIYEKEGNTKEGYTGTPSKFVAKDNIEELTADDAKGTVTFKFKKGIADLQNRLAFPFFVILDSTVDNMSENPVGTGPYAITKYSTGSTTMSLKANEYYWNGKVPFSGMEINFISDSNKKAMALQNGDVDLTENIATINDLKNLQADTDKYTVDVAAGLRCAFSYMNEQEGHPLANADLRKAVLMAIDDDTICNTTVGGMYTAGYSVVPSHLDYGYDQLTDATPYNVEEAKKVLDDAGIKDTDGDGIRELDGKNIELTYYTYDNRALKELAEASQNCIEQLGIKVNLQVTDGDTAWNYLVAGEYDLNATNWTTAEIGDPYSYLDNWYSKSSANYCGYKNDEYDKLYEELADITDTAKRKEIFVKLQQILIDDSAALVHGYYNSNMDSSKAITGATTHTADYYWITTDIKPAE